MKALYVVLFLFSTATWARGYQTGTFDCSGGSGQMTWTISAIENFPSVPFAEYSAIVSGKQDTAVRGIATIEEVTGGTLVGLKGMRGSEKFVLLFNNNGNINMGENVCTKTN
jgi:hypothetical protein